MSKPKGRPVQQPLPPVRDPRPVELRRDLFTLVNRFEWDTRGNVSNRQQQRLDFLDDDVLSAQLSLRGYRLAQASRGQSSPLTGEITPEHVFHYARNFVCAMRRIAANLETLAQEFPPPLNKEIGEIWKRKSRMFKQYTEPRNAIEHHDNKGNIKFVAMSIFNDRLVVTDSEAADISETNLQQALHARDLVLEAVLRYMDVRLNRQSLSR